MRGGFRVFALPIGGTPVLHELNPPVVPALQVSAISQSIMKACSIPLVLACLFWVQAHAAPPVVIVTPGDVEARVRAQNPELAAARHLIDEAFGRLRQAGRLTNPDVEFEVEEDFYLREGQIDVGFSQRFPVTARLRLEKNVRLTEWKAAQAEVREIERQLVAKAREQMVRLLAARQRSELLRQQQEAYAKQSEIIGAAAQRGEIAPSEAGLVRMEAAGIALKLGQLEASEAGMISELKCLLGMRPEEQVQVSGKLPAPVLAAAAVNPSKRSDYEVARLGAEAAGEQVSLEQALRYDDVEAGMFLSRMTREDAPEGYQTDVMVGVKLSIPLP